MGYRLSWIAVHQVAAHQIHEALHLHPPGLGEQQNPSRSPVYVYGAQWSSGWYIIVAQQQREYWMANRQLGQLSKLGPVVACDICETTMRSAASGWSQGQLIWAVLHDSQVDGHELDTYGTLPSTVNNIQNHWLQKQALEDLVPRAQKKFHADYLFEVPADLAESLTGFRHDTAGDVFETLAFSATLWHRARGGFFQRTWLAYPSARFERTFRPRNWIFKEL